MVSRTMFLEPYSYWQHGPILDQERQGWGSPFRGDARVGQPPEQCQEAKSYFPCFGEFAGITVLALVFLLVLRQRFGFQEITYDIHECFFFELWIVWHGKLPPFTITVGGGWAMIPQLPDYKSGALPLELPPPFAL
jgi:hypothetical protein